MKRMNSRSKNKATVGNRSTALYNSLIYYINEALCISLWAGCWQLVCQCAVHGLMHDAANRSVIHSHSPPLARGACHPLTLVLQLSSRV